MKAFCFFLVTVLVVSGCQKNPTDEYNAKILEVQEALNAEDYNRAIELVNSLPANKKEVVKLKSIAYAGRAGFNALKIADLVVKSKDKEPVVLMYELADTFYQTNSVADINFALENIRQYFPEIGIRPYDINAIYGLLQLYKASQLVLKNVKGQGSSCEVIEFIIEDVIDLIYSVNSAALSLSREVREIRDRTQELRLEFSIPDEENFGEDKVQEVKTRLQEAVHEDLGLCNPVSAI